MVVDKEKLQTAESNRIGNIFRAKLEGMFLKYIIRCNWNRFLQILRNKLCILRKQCNYKRADSIEFTLLMQGMIRVAEGASIFVLPSCFKYSGIEYVFLRLLRNLHLVVMYF